MQTHPVVENSQISEYRDINTHTHKSPRLQIPDLHFNLISPPPPHFILSSLYATCGCWFASLLMLDLKKIPQEHFSENSQKSTTGICGCEAGDVDPSRSPVKADCSSKVEKAKPTPVTTWQLVFTLSPDLFRHFFFFFSLSARRLAA